MSNAGIDNGGRRFYDFGVWYSEVGNVFEHLLSVPTDGCDPYSNICIQ